MNPELLAILAAFGVKTEAELLSKKSDEKQTDRIFPSRKPSLVKMDQKHCQTLCERAGVVYMEGYEGRVLQYGITNEQRDRFGDIVRAAGVKFDNYLKNPVVPFAHKYMEPPIASTVNIWADNNLKSVLAWGLFMDDRVDTRGFADVIFKMASNGFLNGCSIGFKPLKTNNPVDPEERIKLGLGPWGVEYLETELLEWSPCVIPCNPTALQASMREMKSLIFAQRDIDNMKELNLLGDDNTLDKFVEELKAAHAGAKTIIVPKADVTHDIKCSACGTVQKCWGKKKPEKRKCINEKCDTEVTCVECWGKPKPKKSIDEIINILTTKNMTDEEYYTVIHELKEMVKSIDVSVPNLAVNVNLDRTLFSEVEYLVGKMGELITSVSAVLDKLQTVAPASEPAKDVKPPKKKGLYVDERQPLFGEVKLNKK